VEQWRPVIGFEELYEVSDLGRVRSLPRKVKRRFVYATLNGKVLRPFPNNQGYLQVTLVGEGQRRKLLVHRMVLAAFTGPCPQGMEGCHEDGDHLNNRLDNLRWDTPKKNHADRVRHGTFWQLNRRACPQGHLYWPGNLVPLPPSKRNRQNRLCLACKRAQAVIRRARLAGRPCGTLAEVSAPYYEKIAQAHSFPPYEPCRVSEQVKTH
jgi:hypothetical protein